MKTTKFVLMFAGLIFLALLAFLLAGVVVTIVQYLFIAAALLVVGTLAYKVLRRGDAPAPQLPDFKEQDKNLERVRRTLAEYKRKELPK
jgi:Flp pilus assembly protein TadB